jgi:hypothetical protein
MDLWAAVRPLSFDVTGESPTGQGPARNCGTAEELRVITRCALAVGTLVLALAASTAIMRPRSRPASSIRRLLRAAASSRSTLRVGAMQAVGGRRAGRSCACICTGAAVVDGPPAHPGRSERPSYHWSNGHLQANVDAAQARGLQVMLTIRSAPNWAQRGGHGTPGVPATPSPDKLRAFTRAAVASSRMSSYWGVWNEPNYKSFLSPSYRNGKLVSPAMYRKLLNSAAGVLHSHGKTVVAGETAPFSHWNRTGASPPLPAPCSSSASFSASTVGPLDLQDERARRRLCHAPVHVGQRVPPCPESQRRSRSAISRMEAARQPRLEGEAHNEPKRPATASPLMDYGVQLGHETPDPRAVSDRTPHKRWTAEALYRTWSFGIRRAAPLGPVARLPNRNGQDLRPVPVRPLLLRFDARERLHGLRSPRRLLATAKPARCRPSGSPSSPMGRAEKIKIWDGHADSGPEP